jgi:hypothetical protein
MRQTGPAQTVSKLSFLLFLRDRAHRDNDLSKQRKDILPIVLLTLAAAVMIICIYAFLSGRLGQ